MRGSHARAASCPSLRSREDGDENLVVVLPRRSSVWGLSWVGATAYLPPLDAFVYAALVVDAVSTLTSTASSDAGALDPLPARWQAREVTSATTAPSAAAPMAMPTTPAAGTVATETEMAKGLADSEATSMSRSATPA